MTLCANCGTQAPNTPTVNSIFQILKNLLLWMKNIKSFSGCLNVPVSWRFRSTQKNFANTHWKIMWHGKSLGKPRLLFLAGRPWAKTPVFRIIPPGRNFVKKNLRKSCTNIFPKICAFCLLYFLLVCSILIIVKGRCLKAKVQGIRWEGRKNSLDNEKK